MGGKAVPQRVGCGGRGQAQLQPGLFHDLGDKPPVEWPAPDAAKERRAGGEVMGTQRGVAGDGGAGGGQDGHLALLAALAADAQRVGERQRARVERHAPRTGAGRSRRAASPRAIVAGRYPVARVPADPRFRACRRRPRHSGGRGRRRVCFGARIDRMAGGVEPLALGPPAVERLDRRQPPGKRARADAARALGGHPGAHLGGAKGAQGVGAGHVARVFGLEGEGKSVRSRA